MEEMQELAIRVYGEMFESRDAGWLAHVINAMRGSLSAPPF